MEERFGLDLGLGVVADGLVVAIELFGWSCMVGGGRKTVKGEVVGRPLAEHGVYLGVVEQLGVIP